MSDIVDRANDEAEAWITEKIRQATKCQAPSPITECVDCGEEIGEKRKQALPHAVRCIKCQTTLEQKK